jgi:hypothetical protein
VDQDGIVSFSLDNNTDTLYRKVYAPEKDTMYIITYKMEKRSVSLQVPAGTFEAMNYQGTLYTPYDIPGVKNPRYLDNYYANHVGRILKTYCYVYGPGYFEKRLVRYYVME